MNKPLVKYEDYTREEVHDIFNPGKVYVPRAGTWGAQGIVRISNTNDFVFFVSYGREQADHIFDEHVTPDGIISWQSQPGQVLSTPNIKQLMKHDHFMNSVYLFLRTSSMKDGKARPYTYLGKLAYLLHDKEREGPVHFKWQILDWDVPDRVLQRMELQLYSKPGESVVEERGHALMETPPPDRSAVVKEVSTAEFHTRKVDHAEVNTKNKALGDAGEILVLELEKQYLIRNGRADLAEKVTHTSITDGDGAGYDIMSFRLDGSIKYIEVKTTTGGHKTPFYLTINELVFSQIHSDDYYIYRIYEFNRNKNSGKFYCLEGDVSKSAFLEPVQFKVRV